VRDRSDGSNIVLTSNFKTTLDDNSESRVIHSGQSGSQLRIAWEQYYSLAKSYSENLTFETR